MKYLLYKFFNEKEHRDDFLNGILFSKKLSYYRKQEDNADGVNDDFENVELIVIADEDHIVQTKFVEIEGHIYAQFTEYEENEKPEEYSETQAFIVHNRVDYNAFCMSSICTDDSGVITKFDKRNKDDFGQYGVLILDMPKFFDRINEALRDNTSVRSVKASFIEYLNFEKRDSVQKWSPFRKFDTFAHQQEYRFVFDCTDDGDLKYKINPLFDIAIQIDDKNAFFESITEGSVLRTIGGVSI